MGEETWPYSCSRSREELEGGHSEAPQEHLPFTCTCVCPSCREGPRSARSRLDELLGLGTATKLLARPGTGERREFRLDKKYQRPQGEEACRAGEVR